MNRRTLTPNTIREIAYRCELYQDIEEATIVGYWTGEQDTWGKLTIRVVDIVDTNAIEDVPTVPYTIYLFSREIVSIAKPEVR